MQAMSHEQCNHTRNGNLPSKSSQQHNIRSKHCCLNVRDKHKAGGRNICCKRNLGGSSVRYSSVEASAKRHGIRRKRPEKRGNTRLFPEPPRGKRATIPSSDTTIQIIIIHVDMMSRISTQVYHAPGGRKIMP